MRMHRLFQTLPFAFVLFVGGRGVNRAGAAARPAAATLPDGIALSKPESVGFSSESLKELDAAMQGIVDKKHLAGIVTLLARHGQVVQHKAYGVQDVDSQTPMQLDTIVRIYSMTKPIAGAAMMMLYEEGKWKPSDPIAKHIPEFANLKVFAGMDADGKPMLVAPTHPPTMGELMSHNAGFTYGLFGNTPVDKMYQADNPLDAPSLQAFIDKVAKLPLLYQPGEKWVYSVSVDIQGYLVAEAVGEDVSGFPARSHLHAARHEGHRLPGAGSQAVARGDDLRVGSGEGRARGAAARSADQQDAGAAVRRRRPVFHRGRLSALRADDAQRRRAERQAAAEAQLGRHDAHQRAERPDAQLEVGHRSGAPAARAGLRLRLRGDERSGGAQEPARQRARTGGGASPAPGSGSIRPTTSCSSA